MIRSRFFLPACLALAMATPAAWGAIVCNTQHIQTFGNTTSLGQSLTADGSARLGPALASSGEGTSSYPYGHNTLTNSILRGAGYYYRLTTPRDHQSWTGWLDGTDHTGDAGGYFLMYDGHQAGTVAYAYDFNDLTADTAYTASAWVANVFRPGAENDVGGYVAPNLTLRIVNADTQAVVASATTGDMPSAPVTAEGTLPWQPIRFDFLATPELVNARLEVINNTTAPYGDDFAIDDIAIVGDCVDVPAPVPVAVPALSAVGLGALGALLALGTWRRRRQAI